MLNWLRLNLRSRQCTWFNSDFSIGSRLDIFLVSQSLLSFVSNCDRPRENQEKGDDTGTRACHGTLSVTCNTAYAHI